MFKFKIVVSAIWQFPFRSRFYEILYGMLHVSLEDCDTVSGLYLQRYSSTRVQPEASMEVNYEPYKPIKI